MRSRIEENIFHLRSELPAHVELIAVSKTKPVSMLQEAYDAGQRHFGENYVQELCEKQVQMPADIQWHFIGPLQSNKVKYIAPFVHLIHGVASLSTLREMNKQGQKLNRKISGLIQIHIAQEETKSGFTAQELPQVLQEAANLDFVQIRGLMAMASFTQDAEQVRSEFRDAFSMFMNAKQSQDGHDFNVLSMGMSGDWKIAVEEGSTHIRVGSSIFGTR
jgi:pyridoxal phosphate enzyme (YggS family)